MQNLTEQQSISILIVDDEPRNIQLLANELKKEGCRIEFAMNGEAALTWIKSTHFDLVLLDIMMPGINGYEVCQQIKREKATRDIPIIFLTAKTDSESIVKGFEAGAVDYITKPFNKAELLARVRTHFKVSYLQRQLQKSNEELERRVEERTLELSQEVVERKKAQARLSQINQISKYVIDSLDLEKASQTFIEQAVKALRSDGSGSILIFDDHKNKLVFYASFGLAPQHIKKFEITVSPETLYTYEVFVSQKGKILDFDELDPFQNEKTMQLHFGRKYVQQIVMPLVSQDKTIGLVNVSHYNSDQLFTNDDFQLLEAISKNLSRHFENIQLYEHRMKLNAAYQRFVPHEFLSLLDKESILDVHLGDQVQKNISILFSDIRSFTWLSEQMTPEENFRFVNGYLKNMGPLVREHHGFIDKYIGDAIMALFTKGADYAVRAGIAMLHALQTYNEGRKRAGYIPIEIGIGINTGLIILGTLGEHNRMDGTVISDTVNLASRLEGLTKLYKTHLLISENTLRSLKDPTQYSIRFLDRVKVKGKTEAISVYEVYDTDLPEIQEKKRKTAKTFEEAWHLYQNKEFQKAESLFQECINENQEDNAAQVFVNWCSQLKQIDHEIDWDGIMHADMK